jgi:hypothetical protein
MQEPAPDVTVVARVLRNPGGYERMRDLQEHRRAATEQRNEHRVTDPTDDALRSEVPVAACHSLRMAACGAQALWPRSQHAVRVPERAIELYGLVSDVREALKRLADALEDCDSNSRV